mmetsp:Transcript_15446/g.22583  ORF Transcript_15446/g.22583 Transcript_15446/m.22583 type:complete len:274 (+) Transcript_15446:142-963(+)
MIAFEQHIDQYVIAHIIASIIFIVLSLLYFKFYVKLVQKDEQLVVRGLTEETIQNGPKIAWLPLLTKSSEVRKVLSLSQMEYCVVKNILSGEKRVEVGPKMVFLQPYDVVKTDDSTGSKKRNALSLKANEYVRFVDNSTGKVRVEYGEQGCVVPGPDEVFLDGVSGKRKAMDLQVFEYVKVQDKRTGKVRTERGEKLVFLGPFEEYLGSKQTAVEVDEETSVLVRNKRTGKWLPFPHVIQIEALFGRDTSICFTVFPNVSLHATLVHFVAVDA